MEKFIHENTNTIKFIQVYYDIFYKTIMLLKSVQK